MAEERKRAPGIYLCVDRDGWTGALQLSIGEVDAKGAGSGYRIHGPKFNGSNEELLAHRVEPRDVDEIRAYLRKVRRAAIKRATEG